MARHAPHMQMHQVQDHKHSAIAAGLEVLGGRDRAMDLVETRHLFSKEQWEDCRSVYLRLKVPITVVNTSPFLSLLGVAGRGS